MCKNMCKRTNKGGSCYATCMSCASNIPDNLSDEQQEKIWKGCGIIQADSDAYATAYANVKVDNLNPEIDILNPELTNVI